MKYRNNRYIVYESPVIIILRVIYDWEFTSRGRGSFAIDDLIFTMAFAHKDVKINCGEYWVCRRNLKESVKHFAGAEDIFDEEKTRRNYKKHLRHIAIKVAIVLVIIALIKKYS